MNGVMNDVDIDSGCGEEFFGRGVVDFCVEDVFRGILVGFD